MTPENNGLVGIQARCALSCKDGLASGIILRMAFDEKYNGMWISTGNDFCFWDKQEFKQILEELKKEEIHSLMGKY